MLLIMSLRMPVGSSARASDDATTIAVQSSSATGGRRIVRFLWGPLGWFAGTGGAPSREGGCRAARRAWSSAPAVPQQRARLVARDPPQPHHLLVRPLVAP